MKRVLLFLFFLVTSTQCLWAEDLPALLAAVDKAPSAKSKTILYNKICKYYWEVDPHLSITYGAKAITLANTLDDKKLLGDALNYTGIAHFWINDLPNATYYAFKALTIRQALADSVGLITNHSTIGNIYLSQGLYDSALTHYQTLLHLAYALKKTQAISNALSNIGEVYEKQNNFDKALPIYLEVLEQEKNSGNTRNIAIDILFIGKTYCKLGRKKEGLAYLEKAYRLSLGLKNEINRLFIFRHLAEIYFEMGDHQEALKLAEEGLAKAMRIKSGSNIEEITFVLNKIYTSRGDYRNAHRYLALHNRFQDSIQNYQKMKYFAEMHAKYESDKKDIENNRLQAETEFQAQAIEHKNKLQNVSAGLLVIALVLAFVFFRGKKREKHNNAQLSEYNQIILQKQVALNQQREELEVSNQQKDLLFSIIAHDLRGPLISLKSLLQLLSMGAVPPEKLDRFVQDLNTQQQNTLGLLDNLLVWAKTQMAGKNLEQKPYCIHKLVERVIHLLEPQAQKKEITLLNEVPGPYWALVDKESLNLVFRNLLSNAIKFSHPGQVVSVSAVPLEMGRLQVTVKDQGIGIRAENQGSLFGLNQYKELGTSNEKGNGLGLMLCKEFIQKNGGQIWIESEAGQGTSCHFSLPSFQEIELSQNQAIPDEEASLV